MLHPRAADRTVVAVEIVGEGHSRGGYGARARQGRYVAEVVEGTGPWSTAEAMGLERRKRIVGRAGAGHAIDGCGDRVAIHHDLQHIAVLGSETSLGEEIVVVAEEVAELVGVPIFAPDPVVTAILVAEDDPGHVGFSPVHQGGLDGAVGRARAIRHCRPIAVVAHCLLIADHPAPAHLLGPGAAHPAIGPVEIVRKGNAAGRKWTGAGEGRGVGKVIEQAGDAGAATQPVRRRRLEGAVRRRRPGRAVDGGCNAAATQDHLKDIAIARGETSIADEIVVVSGEIAELIVSVRAAPDPVVTVIHVAEDQVAKADGRAIDQGGRHRPVA